MIKHISVDTELLNGEVIVWRNGTVTSNERDAINIRKIIANNKDKSIYWFKQNLLRELQTYHKQSKKWKELR